MAATSTPQHAITEMAEELISILPSAPRIFDAGAGTGDLGQKLRQVLPRCKLVGVEKDSDLHNELWAWNKTTAPNLVYNMSKNADITDFKPKDVAGDFDLFISRPPEKGVVEYLEHLLLLSTFNDDCPVVMLFKADLLFNQAHDWVTWWNQQPLHGIRILTGNVMDGYAWFMFNTPGVKQLGWHLCQR